MTWFDALDIGDISSSLSEYDDGVKAGIPDSQGVGAVGCWVKIIFEMGLEGLVEHPWGKSGIATCWFTE